MEKLFTTVEAADSLRKSPQWLEIGRSTGYGLAFIKIGRHVRYREKDLSAYVEQCLQEAVSQCEEDHHV